jgi:hypothetical protein
LLYDEGISTHEAYAAYEFRLRTTLVMSVCLLQSHT